MPAPFQETPDTIVVPSDTPPTLANSNVIDGAIVGAVLGGNNSGLGAGLGAAVGAVVGKEAMEREYREGHRVKKPYSKALDVSVWSLIASATAVAVAVTSFAVTAPLVIAAVAIGGLVAGGFLGKAGYEVKEKEFESAQDYYVRHGGNYRGREREAQSSTVTEAENALLKARLAEAEGRTRISPSVSTYQR